MEKVALLKWGLGIMAVSALTKKSTSPPPKPDNTILFLAQMNAMLSVGNNTNIFHQFFIDHGFNDTALWLINQTDDYLLHVGKISSLSYAEKYNAIKDFLTHYAAHQPNPVPVNPYDEGKLKFIGDVQDYWKNTQAWGDQPIGDISYVRTSAMYSSAVCISQNRRQMRVHSGAFANQTLHEGFNSDIVFTGTFADMANWIKWILTTNRGRDGKSYYGISGDEATQIIEDWVTASGAKDTLGRGGPTCSCFCTVLKSLGNDWGKIIKDVALTMVLVSALIAAPETGGASLLAALPAAAELNSDLKK